MIKIKIPNIKQKFTAFNDGVCDIYIDDEIKANKLCFCDMTLGFKRYYTAQSANTKIDRVIRIPFIPVNIESDYTVCIAEDSYHVELVQPLKETLPKSIQLTLRKLDI